MIHEFEVRMEWVAFKAEYSPQAGFLGYLHFAKGRIVKTIEVRPGCFADVDAEGNLMGLEFVPGLTSRRNKVEEE